MKTPAAFFITVLVFAPTLHSEEPCSDRARSLERQVTEQNHLIRDWGGLIRYGSDNSELSAPAKGDRRVIFFGDQITEYWGRVAPFFPGKPWLNRGIAGQTTDQMLVRFRQDVIDLHPTAVVILAGLNDIAGLQGSHTEEMILDNLTSMTELAQTNGVRVILASVPPSRRQWQDRISELNSLIREYCARAGAIYLDYYSALAEGGNLKKSLTGDGVLPNEAGYAVMAPLSENAIAEAIRK
jgi:lysophospholipase L1-like esterase